MRRPRFPGRRPARIARGRGRTSRARRLVRRVGRATGAEGDGPSPPRRLAPLDFRLIQYRHDRRFGGGTCAREENTPRAGFSPNVYRVPVSVGCCELMRFWRTPDAVPVCPRGRASRDSFHCGGSRSSGVPPTGTSVGARRSRSTSLAEAKMGGGNAQKSAKARADKQAKMAKANKGARARGDDSNARSRTAAIFAPF